jgi:D-amino-acid dehydrogenase
MPKQVVVLGAGMVGVCCALSLRQRGLMVTVIDRREPGRETSFGNSGVFSRSSVFPINGPGLLQKLPVYMANRHPAVRWRASLLSNPRWIAGFLAECTAQSAARRSRALDGLIKLSMDLNRRLMTDAGLLAHLRETGWLKVWRSAEGAGLARTEASALGAFGIATQVLDGAEVARLEPHAAAAAFTAGVLITGSASVDDPGAVVAGYAALARDRGVEVLRAEVRALFRTTTGWRVETTAGSHDGDAVVVALGPWSAEILRPLDFRVPMGFERGYHVHLTIPDGRGPQRAIYDVDGGYVVSPMRAGARVTSGVELALRDAPANTAQIDAAALLARETFGLGAALEAKPWIGSRPTLPDSLPMIGEIPGALGLYAAFGHQHIGFSTGSGTGEIIAAAVAGEASPLDASAFMAGRFGK